MVNSSGKPNNLKHVCMWSQTHKIYLAKIDWIKGRNNRTIKDTLTSLSEIDGTTYTKKITKDMEIWIILSTHFNLNDVYRTLQPTPVDYTFFALWNIY